MNKTVAVSALVLLATLGFSAYAYTIYFPSVSNTSQAGPGSGSLNIYLSDPPPSSPNLSYLLVNVTSVTIKYSANVTAVTTSESSSSSSSSEASSTNATSISTSTTSFASSSTVSISSTAPPSSVNRYVYDVPASVGDNVNLTKLQGSSILLGATKVPSGNVTGIVLQITGAKAFWADGTSTQLKVVADGKLFVNVHFTIQSGGSADLTLNLSPGDIHISPGKASVLTPVIHVTEVSTGARGTQTVETTVSESESSSSTT